MSSGEALGSASTRESCRLWVGSSYAHGGQLAGNLDEFAIFNTVLNQSAVTALYNSGVPANLGAHANIEHYYRMGAIGDTATLIRDQVGGMDLDYASNTPVLATDVPYILPIKVAPYHGLNSTTTVIAITGSNLADVSAVSVGGVACTGVSATAGSVTATVQSSVSTGAQDIIVTDTVNNSSVTMP